MLLAMTEWMTDTEAHGLQNRLFYSLIVASMFRLFFADMKKCKTIIYNNKKVNYHVRRICGKNPECKGQAVQDI